MLSFRKAEWVGLGVSVEFRPSKLNRDTNRQAFLTSLNMILYWNTDRSNHISLSFVRGAQSIAATSRRCGRTYDLLLIGDGYIP